jgi:hypothetical protein
MRPLALTLTVFGALLRVLPHPPNFAPVGGTSLYAGARLRGWQAYLIPLAIMLVTDPLLGAMHGFQAFSWNTPVIYACLMLNVWLGRSLRASESGTRIAATVVLGSLQFFLITNFMTWMRGTMYAHDLSGLVTCYVAAIPFFGRTLLSDVLYTGFLFAAHAYLSRKAFPAEVAA